MSDSAIDKKFGRLVFKRMITNDLTAHGIAKRIGCSEQDVINITNGIFGDGFNRTCLFLHLDYDAFVRENTPQPDVRNEPTVNATASALERLTNAVESLNVTLTKLIETKG